MGDNNPAPDQQPFKVLYVSADSGEALGIPELIRSRVDADVNIRQSRVRALQLLSVTKMDLVICELKLSDSDGLTFLKDMREESGFNSVPIVLIGEDNERADGCIRAFSEGAEDFIKLPFIQGELIARLKRFLKRKTVAVGSSLSVHVGAGELPGILSFLEAEIKTGKLSVRYEGVTADIFLREGRLVNGRAPYCEGLDAITEALSWPESQVTFTDEDVPEENIAFDMDATGTVMNCVFEVDEFREAQKGLPPPDATFIKGDKQPGEEMPEGQTKVLEMLLNSYSIEDVLRGQHLSERRATMFLTELITEGYVKVADPPFHNYTRATYDHYSRSSKFLENRLQDIKTVLSEILFPLRDITGSIPFAPNDWVSPAPKILIITDRKDIGDLFSSSMERLTVDRTNKRPSSRSGAGHVKTTRLNLGERCMLDIVVAPNNLTPILSHVDELILDCFAVCTFVSNQSVKNMQQNLLTARQMRSRFKGVYYFVAPQVKNAHGYYSFDVSCPRCGYTLGVDMDQAGSTGECPICNKKVLIPDCLDYMADAMLLPNDVPIVQIQPTSEKHCRDLMLFMIDSTLNALQPPPEEERGFKHSTQILSDTEVRERMAKPENVVVDIGIDTGTAQEVTPSLPPTPTAAAPEPETESDEPDAFSELFGDVFDDVGTDSVMFDSEDGGEDEGGEGDDFDIDDFISRVKGGG